MLNYVKNNTFTYLFCEAGCVLTQELPTNSQPTYTEFYLNEYSDIYGLKGAMVHASVAT